MKVYGPYLDKVKKRRLVIVIRDDGTRKTMSHARFLLQEHLGRELRPDEEADHIDENPLNDDLSNLQVLLKGDHRDKSSLGNPVQPAQIYVGLCPVCGDEFTKPLRKVIHNRKQGKAGPFCGKSCAGKGSRKPQ
jgi:hypothetical protein